MEIKIELKAEVTKLRNDSEVLQTSINELETLLQGAFQNAGAVPDDIANSLTAAKQAAADFSQRVRAVDETFLTSN